MGMMSIAVAVVWLVSMTCLFHEVRAQNGTRATTDPDEGPLSLSLFKCSRLILIRHHIYERTVLDRIKVFN